MFAKQYADVMAQVSGQRVLISDRDQIIAAAGNGKKELADHYISKPLEGRLSTRKMVIASEDDKDYILVVDGQKESYKYEIISPIICGGDVIGGVILLSKEKEFTELEQKMAVCAAGFLGKQME